MRSMRSKPRDSLTARRRLSPVHLECDSPSTTLFDRQQGVKRHGLVSDSMQGWGEICIPRSKILSSLPLLCSFERVKTRDDSAMRAGRLYLLSWAFDPESASRSGEGGEGGASKKGGGERREGCRARDDLSNVCRS